MTHCSFQVRIMSATLSTGMLTVRGRQTLTSLLPSHATVTLLRVTAAWSKPKDLPAQQACLQVRACRERRMVLGEAATEPFPLGRPPFDGRRPPKRVWDAHLLRLDPFPSDRPLCRSKPPQSQTRLDVQAHQCTVKAARSFCMAMTHLLVTTRGLLQKGWASLTQRGAMEEEEWTGLLTPSRPPTWLPTVSRRTRSLLPTVTAWWRR